MMQKGRKLLTCDGFVAGVRYHINPCHSDDKHGKSRWRKTWGDAENGALHVHSGGCDGLDLDLDLRRGVT